MHSHGEDGTTAASLAVMTTSFIFFCNLFTMGSILKKNGIITRFISTPTEAIVMIICLVFINYFIFMNNKKYINIKNKYSKEDVKNAKIGGSIVLIYCVFSFLLVLLLALYKPTKF